MGMLPDSVIADKFNLHPSFEVWDAAKDWNDVIVIGNG
jgi:hypothetical protein